MNIRCRIILSDVVSGGPSKHPELIKKVDAHTYEYLKENLHVHVYEYEAPKGFEVQVGYGILFANDWSFPDTSVVVQARKGFGLQECWELRSIVPSELNKRS